MKKIMCLVLVLGFSFSLSADERADRFRKDCTLKIKEKKGSPARQLIITCKEREKPYQVDVDYDSPIPKLVYESKLHMPIEGLDSWIEQMKFPKNRSGKKQETMELFFAPDGVKWESYQDQIEHIKRKGCRPTDTRGLIGFAKKYPNIQYKYKIYAIEFQNSEVYPGHICVPVLDWHGHRDVGISCSFKRRHMSGLYLAVCDNRK